MIKAKCTLFVITKVKNFPEVRMILLLAKILSANNFQYFFNNFKNQ